MFQLIVAAIAILIVAALTIASLYFGGDAYKDSSIKALYATNLQQGEQIQGGYKFQEGTTGTLPTGTTAEQFKELTSKQFLSSIPPGDWVVDNYVLYKPLTDTAQCAAVNRVSKKFDPKQTYDRQSPNGCPACDDGAYSDWVACQAPTPMGQ